MSVEIDVQTLSAYAEDEHENNENTELWNFLIFPFLEYRKLVVLTGRCRSVVQNIIRVHSRLWTEQKRQRIWLSFSVNGTKHNYLLYTLLCRRYWMSFFIKLSKGYCTLIYWRVVDIWKSVDDVKRDFVHKMNITYW